MLHIVFGLLKNALWARVEQFWVDKEDKLLPIRVIVIEGIEEIIIKTLDKSGGIERHSPVPIIGLLKVDKGLCSTRVR